MLRLRTLLLAGLLPLASAAHAGDAALTSSSPIAYNWTGFYIGFHGGFGGDQFDYPITYSPPAISGKANLTSSGFFGGGQLGYNWQFAPNWVAGVETDIAGSGIKGEAGVSASGPGGSLSLSGKSTIDYFGTVRGRVGWTNGPLLLYATGGFAYGDTTSSATLSGLGATATVSKRNSHTGWTVGAGVEYALTSKLSLKTEYKYVDLGTRNLYSGPLFGGDALSVSETTRFHSILFGANYRF